MLNCCAATGVIVTSQEVKNKCQNFHNYKIAAKALVLRSIYNEVPAFYNIATIISPSIISSRNVQPPFFRSFMGDSSYT